MASFRTHISFGIALGVLAVIGVLSAAISSDPGLMITLFLAATIGSILPDMDSDSGVPFHIAFGSLSIVSGVLVFFYLFRQHAFDLRTMIEWGVGTALFVWVVIGYIFKRLTHHRGMTHSLAAMLLAGLVTFFVTHYLYISDSTDFLLGVAMMAGYLLHLVLDEIYAALNFNGIPFVPNKALGSALKISSDDTLTNVLVFGAIIFLTAGNTRHFIELGKAFWGMARG